MFQILDYPYPVSRQAAPQGAVTLVAPQAAHAEARLGSTVRLMGISQRRRNRRGASVNSGSLSGIRSTVRGSSRKCRFFPKLLYNSHAFAGHSYTDGGYAGL